MSGKQYNTWACGHTRPGNGAILRNACSTCKARGIDSYRPGQRANFYRSRHRFQKANYSRPRYQYFSRVKSDRDRGERARIERGERYHREILQRERDDRRKRRRVMIRETQRRQDQYAEMQRKRREFAREQDRYEEEREREKDEEYCGCRPCTVQRRERLSIKIHKWLAGIGDPEEEL